MSDDDHCEEQEMEAEALTAIFDECMEIRSSTQPFEWAITLWPEQHQDGDSTNEIENHVGIKVKAIIPLSYPDESSPPQLSIDVVKGLTTEHATELLTLANEVATENAGMPVLYAICERLKEWLLENNVKGMDDLSMYAQMVKREKEKEREGLKAQQTYEAQKQKEEMTEAETEDLEVRRRRADGTSCTDETFEAWRNQFDLEMETVRTEQQAAAVLEAKNKKGSNAAVSVSSSAVERSLEKAGRLTGYQQFSDKTGLLNLEAMEAAAENAQVDEDEDVDENLFDDDDDLDDLDFDDDDEDGDDDEEGGDEDDDEPDI